MEEIKELIEKAIDKLKGDDNLLENFKKDPIKVVDTRAFRRHRLSPARTCGRFLHPQTSPSSRA